MCPACCGVCVEDVRVWLDEGMGNAVRIWLDEGMGENWDEAGRVWLGNAVRVWLDEGMGKG